MTVTAQIRRTLTDTRPLYAVAGAGDLAVAKLRHGLAVLRGDLRDEPKATRERAGTLRHDVAELTHRTEEFAHVQFDKAAGTYDDLAVRGERLVGRIHRQKATTEELVEQAQATVRRARATRTAAREGTEGASASGRGTVTEATKTAGAAAAAGRRAAERIGD